MKLSKILLFITITLSTIRLQAQLNLSCSYNNRSILYENAQCIHGFNFDILYKSANQKYGGIDISFNRSLGIGTQDITLVRALSQNKYHEIFRSHHSLPVRDSNALYKDFKARPQYTYVSFSFKHFKPFRKNGNSTHFFGYNIGFNFLTERMIIKNDSVDGTQFYGTSSLTQLMFGLNYQREIILKKQLSFIYGAALSASIFPLMVFDFDGISGPLVTGSISCGLRIYLWESKP